MLGAYIKLLRREEKRTQKAFASLLNVSQGFLSQVEQGKKMPTLEMLLIIRDQFEADINNLFDNYAVYAQED